MIVDAKKLAKSINSRLLELNTEISESHVRAAAFFTDYDEEFEGIVANIVFVVEGEKVDDDLEKLDEYCTKANDILADLIVFANCIYRTSTEYEADFKTAEWENVIQEVINGQD